MLQVAARLTPWDWRQMPPKKRSAAGSSTAAVNKKYKSAIDEAADEWICPITTELQSRYFDQVKGRHTIQWVRIQIRRDRVVF